MNYTFKTKGVCPSSIEINVEDGIVKDVNFNGGCNGNLKAVSRLVRNKNVEEVISILEGIHCGSRSTSCGDQLAQALKQTL